MYARTAIAAHIGGTITDTSGIPLANVAVTDGKNITLTDSADGEVYLGEAAAAVFRSAGLAKRHAGAT
mgnify:CR=1 FL=1